MALRRPPLDHVRCFQLGVEESLKSIWALVVGFEELPGSLGFVVRSCECENVWPEVLFL